MSTCNDVGTAAGPPGRRRCLHLLLALAAATAHGGEAFTRLRLDDRFTCEGADAGDIDGDGKPDIVAGPWWFGGPGFSQRTAYAPEKVFDPNGYSTHFLTFVADLDGDGRDDILVIDYPRKPARWYRNPGPGGQAPWAVHVVTGSVSSESPIWADLNGDGRGELVTTDGRNVGWYEPGPTAPDKPWTFHPIGPGYPKHGLGVGDIDGDGRRDVVSAGGWWRQPESLAGDPPWTFTKAALGSGGAQMPVADVDGDGLADVVTSINAHGYGLSWFRQTREGSQISFIEQRIVDANSTGIHKFSQPHAVAMADVDGDGRADIITGKRRWAHGPKGDVDAMGTPVLFWFRCVGTGRETRFEPHLVDDASGVGTQVLAADLDGDRRADIVSSNKLGIVVFLTSPPTR